MHDIESTRLQQLMVREPLSSYTIEDTWEKLLTDGYTIVADSRAALGFDPTFREYVNATYFGEQGILEPEQYDVFPPDRRRARGAVAIHFTNQGESVLRDLPPTPVINKDRGQASERLYKQTPLMNDKRVRHWLTTLAGLIPPPAEYIPGLILDTTGGFNPNAILDVYGNVMQHPPDKSTNRAFYCLLIEQPSYLDSRLLRCLSGGGSFMVGVNLFEVHRDVVSGPHQDNTRWNAITVIDKQGVGAASQLYDLYDPKPRLEITLEPGQTLIVNDQRFRHSATPLQPAADGKSYRRTIVCTFDFVPAQTSVLTDVQQ